MFDKNAILFPSGENDGAVQKPVLSISSTELSRSSGAVHTDEDATLLEWRQKFGGGELRALIGVPDFGLTEAKGGLERSQAETALHSVGEFPTEHEAAEPIHHCH